MLLLSVSQLREHWEDTSTKVHARKTQLEELAIDNRHFEAKRQEIDCWLSRMEAWQSRLRPIGSTKDVLEQQSREQKVNTVILYVEYNTYCTLSLEFPRRRSPIQNPHWRLQRADTSPDFHVPKRRCFEAQKNHRGHKSKVASELALI